MAKDSTNHSKDIQGAKKLAVDAIVGITEIVESLHHTIVNLGGKSNDPKPQQTKGITGTVLKNIRTITEVTGKGLDVALNHLSLTMAEKPSSPRREFILSALNGVLGDYLEENDNSLAVDMQFRREGKPLNDDELLETIQKSNGRLAIMVHGSSMNDLQWNREGHDHGASLSRDLGLTTLYLHYNTGLHTSENGKRFATLLETIMAQSTQSNELVIIAHSMGGLVSRSACYYAEQWDHTWLRNLKKLVFLGTPHHGALLERGGNWIDNLLEANPYSAPLARLGKIRSEGLTDLRYGNVVDEDWKAQNRFEMAEDSRVPVPLPKGIQCYAMAGSTSKDTSHVGDQIVGDGLVTVNSAMGHHTDPQMQLLIPKRHLWLGREMNHFEMLNHPEAYAVIKQWLTT